MKNRASCGVLRAVYAAAVVSFASVAWAKDVFVATTGSDTDGEGTAAVPYATLTKAVSVAAKGDVIKVAGGVYEEAVVNGVAQLTVSGSWNADFTARDLRNCRTVIKAPTNKAICWSANSVSNRLDGVDLTGGLNGFKNTIGDNTLDKSATGKVQRHHVLDHVIITNCTVGILDAHFHGLVVKSSLLAHNEQASDSNVDNGAYQYYYNCTFADNAKSGIERRHGYDPIRYVRNCIFLRNGKAIYDNSTSGNSFCVYNNLFYGNDEIYYRSTVFTTGISPVWYYGRLVVADPKLGDDYAIAADSPAAKIGQDLSADSVEPVADDLYGAPWNGAYDLGCVKTDYVSSLIKSDELYVSPDGDDEAAGDADHPLATPAMAALRINDGGTVHLANGTYRGMALFRTDRVTIVGESVDGTIVQGEKGGVDNHRPDFAIGFAGASNRVENLTCTLAAVGVYVGGSSAPAAIKDNRVENCVLRGCHHGFMEYVNGRSSGSFTYLSHLVSRDNAGTGLNYYNSVRVDNALIADNGSHGIYANTWDTSGTVFGIYLTVTGNGGWGYYTAQTTYPYSRIYNSIFEGNASGGFKGMGNKGYLYSCDFWNNGGDAVSPASVVQDDTRTVDPKLDATATLRGHLLEGSPCAQSGKYYAQGGNVVVSPTDDLAYFRRLEEKVDLGCYISPETMNDLAGDGYHILNIEGDPNGYGTVSPNYGRSLHADGQCAFSVKGTLYTEELDGVRATRVKDGTDYAEGVRAAYKGYAYTLEGAGEPQFSSQTEESLDVLFQNNATMSWKWERQNMFVVSTDAPGCKVRINDGEAAACVTNWIKEGTTCTVAFLPTSDFEFAGWTGDFPAGDDPRYQTTTVTSDRPHAFHPSYRKLIHVTKTGDDETGNGTLAAPYLTINKAISVAGSRDVIYVGHGTYEEAVVNGSVDELTISGGWDDDWQRDLVNAQTVINPGDTKKDCVTIKNCVSNTVSGFVLTGGRYGVYSVGRNPPSSLVAEYAVRQHNYTQLIITNNASGGLYEPREGGNKGSNVRLVSSLVAFNKGMGVQMAGDTVACGYIHNCTIVSNNSTGVHLDYGYTSYDIRNSIIWGNKGDAGVTCENTGIGLTLGNNIIGGKTVAVKWSNGSCWSIGGNQFADPLLDGNCVPTEGSPAVKAGRNLRNYPLAAELQDVYGNEWNGEYDVGCFKTAYVQPAKLAACWVSPEGDDAAAGDAAHPFRTVQQAVRRAAENGIVQLAAGDYDGPVSLNVPGLTLRGAGIGKTVIHGAKDTLASDFRNYLTLEVAADDVTIEGLTVTGGTGAGLYLDMNHFAKNALVRDCAFTGNGRGIYSSTFGNSSGTRYMTPEYTEAEKDWARHRLSRCFITDNTTGGIYVDGFGYCAMIADNLLVARNQGDGIFVNDRCGSGWHTTSYFYYCTVVDNTGAGVSDKRNGDGGHPYVYNSVITRNGTGLARSLYDEVVTTYSAVSGNTLDWDAQYGGSFPNAKNNTDAPVVFTDDKWGYRLDPSSAGYGFARALTASDKIAEPATDLIGTPRKNKNGKRDAGCFARVPNGLLIFAR